MALPVDSIVLFLIGPKSFCANLSAGFGDGSVLLNLNEDGC